MRAVVVVISILHLVSASAVPQAFGKGGPPGSARVGQGDPPADVAAVAAAERAFAKLAAEKGVADAFVATAAEDGILLRPGPVNARDFMSQRPKNPGPLLAWGPSYVEVAASGELAWDTGPWAFHPDRAKPAVAWGHFATVWRKDADGTWRWLIDHGHDMPAAGPDEGFVWARASDGKSKLAQAPSAKDGSTPASAALTAADRAYEEALASGGLAQALARFGAPDVRVYREGKAPGLGAAAQAAFPDEWRGGLKSAEPHTGAVSRSGDLGFTYGTIALADTSVSRHGRNYVRIWRNDGRSGWRVALDVVNEIPPPPAAPPAPAAPAPPESAPPPPAPPPAPSAPSAPSTPGGP
jgi:ketosteroid isomerase-like protein